MAAACAVPAFSQQTRILTAEKHNEYGLVYSLPITALKINVTARRETSKAGPFSQYAKRYLGTSNVVASDGVSWTITEVSIQPVGVKGDDEQYLMQLKPGATTYIGVAQDGMLLSINTEPQDVAPSDDVSQFSEGKLIKTDGDVDDFLKLVDMDYLSAQNSMRQAEMVASRLMDIKEAYADLTTGSSDNMPSDGRQYELMLKSLEDQRDALSRAFSGSVTVEEFQSQYIYIPEKEGEEVLFRLSDFAGFVDSDDYSGSPVYIRTEIVAEGTMPEDVNGEPKKFPKDGIVYSIPGVARMSISSNGRNLLIKEVECSQFGTTFALAPTLFIDRKSPSYARFNPTTGALMEIGTITPKEKE